MIRTGVLLAIFAAVSAASLGVMAGKEGAEDSAFLISARKNAPVVPKPGPGVAEAGAYLADLNPPPPPPPPPFVPPGPDVALTFRRELAAVLGAGADRYLLMKANGIGVGRPLKRGEVYMDGWILTALNETEATLTKGNEARTVYLYAAAEPPLRAAPVPATVVAGSLGIVGAAGRAGAAQAGRVGAAPIVQANRAGGFVVQGGNAALAGRAGAPAAGGRGGGGRGG